MAFIASYENCSTAYAHLRGYMTRASKKKAAGKDEKLIKKNAVMININGKIKKLKFRLSSKN